MKFNVSKAVVEKIFYNAVLKDTGHHVTLEVNGFHVISISKLDGKVRRVGSAKLSGLEVDDDGLIVITEDGEG